MSSGASCTLERFSYLLSTKTDDSSITSQLGYGDIWCFPKGVAHTIQGLQADNEYLLVFDNANFDALG
jgi:oxalate decarboxylase